jgi:hypothetical protein
MRFLLQHGKANAAPGNSDDYGDATQSISTSSTEDGARESGAAGFSFTGGRGRD